MKKTLFELLDDADRIQHYDNSYSRYHRLNQNDIKGYNPDKQFKEIGTDIKHVLIIIAICLILFIFVTK